MHARRLLLSPLRIDDLAHAMRGSVRSVIGLSLFALMGSQAQAVHAAETESICEAAEGQRSEVPSEPVELCGVTTISGASPARMDVFFPVEASLEHDFRPGEDINLEGKGRFVGFVLAEDVPERDGNALTVGMLPEDLSENVYVFLPDGPSQDRGPSVAVFPPGAYTLYLIADGSPAKVTLRFSELSGHVEFAPTTTAQVDLREPEPRITVEPNQAVYTAREYATLQTVGMGFRITWIVTADHAASSVGSCLFPPNALSDAYSYVPGMCWDGGGGAGNWITIPAAPGFLIATYGTDIGLPPGEWGLGGYFESASRVERFGALVFWLDMN